METSTEIFTIVEARGLRPSATGGHALRYNPNAGLQFGPNNTTMYRPATVLVHELDHLTDWLSNKPAHDNRNGFVRSFGASLEEMRATLGDGNRIIRSSI